MVSTVTLQQEGPETGELACFPVVCMGSSPVDVQGTDYSCYGITQPYRGSRQCHITTLC